MWHSCFFCIKLLLIAANWWNNPFILSWPDQRDKLHLVNNFIIKDHLGMKSIIYDHWYRNYISWLLKTDLDLKTNIYELNTQNKYFPYICGKKTLCWYTKWRSLHCAMLNMISKVHNIDRWNRNSSYKSWVENVNHEQSEIKLFAPQTKKFNVIEYSHIRAMMRLASRRFIILYLCLQIKSLIMSAVWATLYHRFLCVHFLKEVFHYLRTSRQDSDFTDDLTHFSHCRIFLKSLGVGKSVRSLLFFCSKVKDHY